jgi:hypothetical protein
MGKLAALDPGDDVAIRDTLVARLVAAQETGWQAPEKLILPNAARASPVVGAAGRARSLIGRAGSAYAR